jgi:hypothetical protein
LLIMSQMSRFRAQSGPSSKSFVALSTKLAAVMLLRYCWYTKICTQKKAPPKKNSPQIPPLRFHSLLLLTISRALTKSPQTPTPTLADALSLSHTHTHSLSLSLSSFSLATRRPPDGAVANCRPADGTVTSESDRERSWGNFLRRNKGGTKGNVIAQTRGQHTPYRIRVRRTHWLHTFPVGERIGGWGTFVRSLFPSKFDSSTYSTLIPLLMSWRKKASWDFQN